MRKTSSRFGLVAIAVIAGLSACSAPFTTEVLSLAEDEAPPSLVITSPEDQSYYARTILISGSVSDQTGTEGVRGQVVSLRYSIPAASISEEIPVDQNGNFSIQVSTNLLSGDTISVLLAATDLNGNTSTRTISLLYGGSDIATFEATPGNQQVTLSWDPIPGASEYTIRNLGESKEVSISGSSSEYVWSDLTNGENYFFEIESTDGLGQTNTSSVIAAVPLSPFTLLPRVENYSDRIRLTWRPMPGITRFVVEKSTSIDGPYFQREIVEGTEFSDYNVSLDTFYYYRIYPEGQPAIKGAPMEGILVPFASSGSEPSDYFGPMNSVRLVERAGNYVFAAEVEANGDYSVVVLDASDPSNLVEVERLVVGGAQIVATAIDNTLDILFVALDEEGVGAIDISDPLNLVALSVPNRLLDRGDVIYIEDIDIGYVGKTPYLIDLENDGVVYVAEIGLSGSTVSLTVRDTTSPSDPSARSGALSVYGTYAYVTMNDGWGYGFDSIDFSTPTTVSRNQGTYRTGVANGEPEAILATPNYVYLGFPTTSGGAIDVVDTDGSPLYNRVSLDREIRHLTVSGGLLYASSLTDGVYGFDETGIATSEIPMVQADSAGSAYSAVVVNGYIVAAALSGVETFKLLELLSESTSRNYVTDAGANGNLTDFTSVGDDAHFIHLTQIYPADLSNMASFAGLSTASGLSGGGQSLLQGTRQIVTVDYLQNELTATTVPGELPYATYGQSTGKSFTYYSTGEYIYGYSGSILTIYDSSELDAFPQLRSVALDVGLVGLVGQKNLLIGASSTDLLVLEISDPLLPTEIARIDVSTDIGRPDLEVTAIQLHNDQVYLAFKDDNGTPGSNNGSLPTGGADDTGGFAIYSVSDPENPVRVGLLEQGAAVFDDYGSEAKHFESLVVTGDYAILATGFGGSNGVPGTSGSQQYEGRIEMFNVADPGSIYKIRDILPDGNYVSVGVADFPEEIHLFKNRYLFVFGRDELSFYEL